MSLREAIAKAIFEEPMPNGKIRRGTRPPIYATVSSMANP